MREKSKLYEDERIKKYLEKLQRKSHNPQISLIRRYLRWRGFNEESVDELLESGMKETEHLLRYEEEVKSEGKSVAYVSPIKKFLRENGILIPRKNGTRASTTYYEDDKLMIDFLRLHRRQGTKRNANRALADYIMWRTVVDKKEWTPSKLADEGLHERDLRLLLLDFYDARVTPGENLKYEQRVALKWLKGVYPRTAWQKVHYIKRFYRRILPDDKMINVVFERTEIPKEASISNYDDEDLGDLPTKEDIKKMIDVSTSVRDKAIIGSLHTSGASSIDLVRLTYGQMKHGLNIDDPNDVPQAILIPITRRKVPVKGHLMLGQYALRFISMWLKQRTTKVLGYEGEILTDDSAIFTSKTPDNKIYSEQQQIIYTPLSNNSILRILEKLVKRASLDVSLSCGSFRDNFATVLEDNRCPPSYVSKWMCHKGDIKSKHYIKIKPEKSLEQYIEFYHICFSLETADVAYKTLQESTTTLQAKVAVLESEKSDLEKTLIGFKEDYDPVIQDLIDKMNTQTKLILEMQEREQERYQQDYDESMRDEQEIKKEIMKKLKEKEK